MQSSRDGTRRDLEKLTSDANPVVSVIVPARNEEACLALCLESLVSQTGIVFELIVVDDASTDRTAEIARLFVIREGTTSVIPEKAYSDTRSLSPAPEAGTGVPLLADAGKGTSFTRAEYEFGATNGTAEGRALPTGPECCVNVTVISAPPLPENWTGKNNAMSAGAKIAHKNAKWLLFTDADTVHKPGSLARAVAEAEQHGAALLSYSPEQEVHGFWEKAVMPVIFAELAATYPPKKVNDPASPIAAANGQYLLISREAYDAVGGHTKIASDLLEDVAMARLVKSSGRRIFFRYGGDAVRTRMYRSWTQMKEGWTKNLALLFPKPGELAAVQLVVFVALIGTVISCFSLLLAGKMPDFWPTWLWPTWSWRQGFGIPNGTALLLLVTYLTIRTRKAHFGWISVTLAPVGLALVSFLLLRSKYFYSKGRLDWRDRTYVYTAQEIEALRNKRAARTT